MENELLSHLVHVVHDLFLYTSKVLPGGYLPYFRDIAPLVANLVLPNRSYFDLQWGLCIFDDVVEFGGAVCFGRIVARRSMKL